MGNASTQEKTQWIKEESASKHEFLFSRRRAKPDFIATALRAAAVGFHGRGSAGKSISGAAVWRGSKKGPENGLKKELLRDQTLLNILSFFGLVL